MIYFINSKKYTNGPPFYAAKKELDKVNFKYELIKEDKTTTIKYNEIDLMAVDTEFLITKLCQEIISTELHNQWTLKKLHVKLLLMSYMIIII